MGQKIISVKIARESTENKWLPRIESTATKNIWGQPEFEATASPSKV
jgi:hypothetical protein